MTLFGLTAKEWRQACSDAKENIRDVASLQQLMIMANRKSLNDKFVYHGLPRKKQLSGLMPAPKG